MNDRLDYLPGWELFIALPLPAIAQILKEARTSIEDCQEITKIWEHQHGDKMAKASVSSNSSSTSWSAGRTKQKNVDKIEAKIASLKAVDSVLLKLARDNDLAEDLQHPAVKQALLHWTNVERLDPEEAATLHDNYRVVSVLQKLQTLQYVCSQAGIPVPIDHFLQGTPELSLEIRKKVLGDYYPYVSFHPMGPTVIDSNKSESSKESTAHKKYMKTFDAELKNFENGVKESRQKIAEVVASENETITFDSRPLWQQILYWGYEVPNDPCFAWWRFTARAMVDVFLLGIGFWLIAGPKGNIEQLIFGILNKVYYTCELFAFTYILDCFNFEDFEDKYIL